MAQKVTYWLLLTLILSLGFGQLLRFDFYGLPIYLHDILVMLILAIQGLTCDWRSVLVTKRTFLDRRPEQSSSRDTEGGRRVLKGTIGLKFFLLALVLSSLRALTFYPLSSLIVPFLYLIRILSYIALYFLIKSQKIKIPNSIFIISAMVTCVIGFAQYIFIPDMRIFQYLGWDDHLSRLTLPHFDPTFTAVMLGLALLSNINKTKIWGLSSIFYIIAILLTYSRSVWFSLICTGLLFIKNKKIILVSGVLLLISIISLPQKFGEGTNLLRTFSISSRLEYDLGYIQKYKLDLLIGRGMNTLIVDSNSESSSHATGPNNSYLYLLLTTGILGLLGWGIFMRRIYRDSIYKPMLVFFLISSLFNNVMFYPFALLWVLLISAMVPSEV